MISIRNANLSDLEAITKIYNLEVASGTATLDTTPKTLSEQDDWFRAHGKTHPIIVAELESQIAGWASLSAWSGRCAYSQTAETSFYVDRSSQGQGVGRELLVELVKLATELKFHSLLARITQGSDASIHLHQELGFIEVGLLKEVGNKFGEHLDVYMLQLILEN